MKIFNKNRKSFGNNYRNNTGYQSNDRNNKFGRKNGGRNKVVKSERFQEEEDPTPWHVMKQNLKPSVAVKNPEIEDDWNTQEEQNAKAEKQAFMRQKDERYRKFVIESERKTLSKWDSFSDVEQSADEGDEVNNSSDGSVDNQIIEITGSVEKTFKKKGIKSKFQETAADGSPNKKIKANNVKPAQQATIEHEPEQPVLIREKIIPSQKLQKKKLKNVETRAESPKVEEAIIADATEHTKLSKPKAMKKVKKQDELWSFEEVVPDDQIDDDAEHPAPEEAHKNKKSNNLFGIEAHEETFLESLASQKQNEPLLFENATKLTKSGPKCFFCRQYGHSLKQCREFDNTSTRICIKCGSSEHAYQNCPIHKGRVFKFAACFICKQTGHISSQCKEKTNGVYPDGGNCRYCSSKEHLGLNCPKRPGRKKKKFSKNRNSTPNVKIDKVQNAEGEGDIGHRGTHIGHREGGRGRGGRGGDSRGGGGRFGGGRGGSGRGRDGGGRGGRGRDGGGRGGRGRDGGGRGRGGRGRSGNGRSQGGSRGQSGGRSRDGGRSRGNGRGRGSGGRGRGNSRGSESGRIQKDYRIKRTF